MTCVLCKQGATSPGRVMVALQRGATTVIIKDVAAEVCENCGEHYLDEDVTEQILSMAEDAAKKNAEVEILRFPA